MNKIKKFVASTVAILMMLSMLLIQVNAENFVMPSTETETALPQGYEAKDVVSDVTGIQAYTGELAYSGNDYMRIWSRAGGTQTYLNISVGNIPAGETVSISFVAKDLGGNGVKTHIQNQGNGGWQVLAKTAAFTEDTAAAILAAATLEEIDVGDGWVRYRTTAELREAATHIRLWVPTITDYLIDNIDIRKYDGESIIELNAAENKFAVNNGTVDFTLSEEIHNISAINNNNIVIEGLDGTKVTNFTVSNVTKNSFTIAFDGEVKRGIYKAKLIGVVGEITGSTEVTECVIRTDYEYYSLDSSYVDMTFNDYNGGAGPSDGNNFEFFQYWITEPEAKRGVGDEGDDTDGAFWIENAPVYDPDFGFINLYARSYVYPLTDATKQGEILTVAFKVKVSDNMDWYIKLFDTGETEVPDNSGTPTKNNSILGFKDGVVKYGTSKTSLGTITGAGLATDAWVDVAVTITPVSATKSKIKVKIGNVEYDEVETSRNFFTTTQSKLGIAYEPTDDTNSFMIDDIVVNGCANIAYPEVENIKAYDYLNNIQKGKELTSATPKIEITFNTLVDHDSINDALTITGIDDWDIEPNDINGKTVLDLNILSLLKPSEYGNKNSISVSLSDDIFDVSGHNLNMIPFSVNYDVARDEMFKIYEETDVNNASTEYVLKIAKTNDEAYNFISVIACYQTKNIDGKEYKDLVGIAYVPVEYAADETGIKELQTNIPLNGCDTVEVTKINMPSMSIFE